MSAAKHTPGPWDKGRAGGIGQVFNAEGRKVCDVMTNLGDLNLITAAPELLEAANSAERLLQIAEKQAGLIARRAKLDCAGDGRFGIAVKTDPEAKEWQALEQERNELVAFNRAAIAKATGSAA